MHLALITTACTLMLMLIELPSSAAKYYKGSNDDVKYTDVFSVQETDMDASVMSFTSSARSIIECSIQCSPDDAYYFKGACYKINNGQRLVNLSVARNDELPQVMVYNQGPGYVGKFK